MDAYHVYQHLERLQQKHEELKKSYDLVSKKQGTLRRRQILETHPVSKLEWERSMEDADYESRDLEAELGTVERQIESIKRDLGGDTLYHALLRLDFRRQAMAFKHFFEEDYPVGGFLIHGKPDHGQRWLLNRLLNVHYTKLVTHGALKVIQFDLQRRTRRIDIDTLWRELAREVGLAELGSTKDVIERIYTWWQTQTVVFVFHNLHATYKEYMKEFIQKLWIPLASVGNKWTGGPSNFYLLFLIDYADCIEDWSSTFTEHYNTVDARMLIKLDKLTPFSQGDLEDWIFHEVDTLPSELTAQAIFECTDGHPQLVLEHICDLCSCRFAERESLWMKY